MRSMSGIGTLRPAPNIRPTATCFGIWSTEEALKMLRRAERLEQRPQVDRPVQGVGVRVAEVGADRVAVAVGEDRAEAGVDRLEGLVPARLDQLAVAADQRRREPVGVGVQLAEAGALRADEALAEDVVGVAADLASPRARRARAQPAGRLAERTGAVATVVELIASRPILADGCAARVAPELSAPGAVRASLARGFADEPVDDSGRARRRGRARGWRRAGRRP